MGTLTLAKAWFGRLPVAERELRQHALALQGLMLGMLGVTLLSILLGVLLLGSAALTPQRLLPGVVIVLGMAGGVGLLRSGRIVLAVSTIIVLVMVAVTWGLLNLGIAQSVSFTLYLIPLLLAGFMLSRRGLLLVATSVLLLPFGVLAVEYQMLTPAEVRDVLVRILRFSLVVVLFTLFTDRYAITMRRALRRAEDQQELLEERVQERTAQLEERTRQLEWSNGQLLASNRRLELANQELEAFSYSVSHDLRAPLRGVAGFSQVLREDYGDRLGEQGQQYLSRIEAGAEKMAGLIDDFLVLSRIARTDLRPKWVNLSDVARAAAAEVAKDYTFTFYVEEGLEVRGDERLLATLMVNLIENAAKYSSLKETSLVQVFTVRSAEQVAYVVADNGVGFDMAYAERLFAPFQRLHGEEYAGSGVGLATVQRIVRRHGGRIWAESKPGEGAQFFFTLNEEPLAT